jgi:transcriptional regulator with XRE-family HTH domain
MALRLSRTSITNIEAGRQPVQIHTIYKIAEILEVPVTSLLPAGTSDPSSKKISETNITENEWLQKITPEGDLTNERLSNKITPSRSRNPSKKQDHATASSY